jgi:hypothetical protein
MVMIYKGHALKMSGLAVSHGTVISNALALKEERGSRGRQMKRGLD